MAVDVRLVVGAATDVGRVREGNEDGYLVDERDGARRRRRRHGRPPRRRGRERHRARSAARRGHQRAIRCAKSIEDANEAVFTKSLTDDELRGHGHHAHRGNARERRTPCSSATSATRARTSCTTASSARSPTTTAWSRSSSTTGGSPPTRPRSTRCATIITRALGVDASGRRRRVPGGARARRPRAASAPTASPTWCTTTSIAAELRREDDPTRAATRARRRRQPRGRRRQHHRRRDRGHRRGAAPRAIAAPVGAGRADAVDDATARAGAGDDAAGDARQRAALGRMLLWVLPIVARPRHRGRRGRLVRAQQLLRRRQPRAGHRVQGRARRPARGGTRRSSGAPRSRRRPPPGRPRRGAATSRRSRRSTTPTPSSRRIARSTPPPRPRRTHDARRRRPRRPPRPRPLHRRPRRRPLTPAGAVSRPDRAGAGAASELGLGLMAVVVTGGGYVLLLLADKPDIPRRPLGVPRSRCSGSTSSRTSRSAGSRRVPTRRCCRSRSLLNGIGFVTISRLDRDLARVQAVWTAVGVGAFVVTLWSCATSARSSATGTRSCCSASPRCSCRSLPGRRARDQRRAALGARRAAELPAGRGGQGAARDLLRRVPRRQARAARRRARRASSGVGAPRPEAPRPAAARVGLLDPGDGPPEGPRVVAPLLRGVRGDALHRHRALARTSSSRSACSSPAPSSRTSSSATSQDRVQLVDRPVVGRRRPPASSSCSRCSRSAAAGFAGTGLGLGSPQKIPNASTDFVFSAIGEELGLHRHRRGLHPVPAVRRQRVPHRDPGRPPVLEAVRRRPHHDRRRADVRDRRRRDPRDPAHRRDAAVHLVRRIVARRQLRDRRAAAAHLRRDGRARRRCRGAVATARDRDAADDAAAPRRAGRAGEPRRSAASATRSPC